MNMKAAMKKKIHSLDFAILEMGIYLDTHAWDKRALRKRQALQMERKNAVMAYESKFGPYIVTSQDVLGDSWTWGADPWPWEYCSNEEV